MAALEFWYEFGSTYSYLSAMRIEPLAAAAGVTITWKPFLLGPLFQKQGWSDSPFNLYPARGRYMWRDVERWCAEYGIPFARPTQFPRNGLLAARVALLAAGEPWGPGFARAVYAANFAEDRDIAAPAVIGAILRSLGQDAETLLSRAQSPETKQRLRDQTDEAWRRGIFGAPSFLVGDELFWGNDRLEQALRWCARPT